MGPKVLLVFPRKFGSLGFTIPISLVYLALGLIKAGYKVEILDMGLKDYRKMNFNSIDYIGISCMGGNQFIKGIEFTEYVKDIDYEIPIMWGGTLPSIFPEHTLRKGHADVVIRNEGEITIVETLNRLSNNKDLNGLEGITYIKNDKIKSNPDRKFIDLDSVDINLPYDLLDLEKYPIFQRGVFPIQTSRGCPHRCGFCYNNIFHRCTWRGKSPERVVSELEYVTDKFNPSSVWFFDDNFFTNKDRVESICKGMLKMNIDLYWNSSCRADYISNYDKKFLRMLEESKCKSLQIGCESGSDRILSIINKGINTQVIIKVMKKLAHTNIKPILSFMTGFPGESENDLYKTLDMIDNIMRVNNNTLLFGIYIYTPLPGTPLYERVKEKYDLKLDQVFDKWISSNSLHEGNYPWLETRYRNLIESISIISLFLDSYTKRAGALGLDKYKGIRFTLDILNFDAQMRWKYRFFHFPFEWLIVKIFLKYFRGFI